MSEVEAGGELVMSLLVDEAGRLVTEPATMVAMSCGCHEVLRGRWMVGDGVACSSAEHGAARVTGAIETSVTIG